MSEWKNKEDARQVLNYRKHSKFNNPMGTPTKENPEGKLEWHHIHEDNAKGPHSVKNLALTTRYLNGIKFNEWFTKPRGLFHGKSFDGMSVREFLRGKDATLHREWGMWCIKDHKLRIHTGDHGRGRYQELV